MIIYALIIIAVLFFLSWNLISNHKAFIIASSITTLLFIVAVGFAVANYNGHYGMHRVTEPAYSRRINSLSPLNSVKMITYQPMGSTRDSQLVIYKNQHQKVNHTAPDLKVKNRIVKDSKVSHPHVVTHAVKWTYRNSWDRAWFRLAKKPSVAKVSHTFYVPQSWSVLSDKQSLAFKQIIKNRSQQLKRQANSSQARQRMKQQASAYVKAQMVRELSKHPRMTSSQKKGLTKWLLMKFKKISQQKMINKISREALKTAKTV